MRRRSVLRIWMVSLLLSAPANAYDIGAGIDLKGSVELKNFTSFQTKDTADSLRFRDELVLQLELERRFGSGSVFVATKLTVDQGDSTKEDNIKISDDVNTVLKEAYLNLYLPNLDLRLGKQIFSWGRTDLINPTDNLTSSSVIPTFSLCSLGIET